MRRDQQIMKKLFSVFLLLAFLIIPSVCTGKTTDIIAEGIYIMGDGETMTVAEERARKEAERHAAEKAGAFVKSYTKVKDLALEKDVIEVIANHSMKVTVLAKKRSMVGDAVRFYCKIKAVVSTEEVESNLRKVAEDREFVEAYNKIKVAYNKQAQELEVLKKKLTEVEGKDRKTILIRIGSEENRFKANLWLERGYALADTSSPVLKGRYAVYSFKREAFDAFSKAAELDPALPAAFVGRSRLQRVLLPPYKYKMYDEKLEALHKALADLNRAIALDPSYASAYYERSQLYRQLIQSEYDVKSEEANINVFSNREEAAKFEKEVAKKYVTKMLSDIDKAIDLRPDNPKFFHQRAEYLRGIDIDVPFLPPINRNLDGAINDMTRAISLCQRDESQKYYLKRLYKIRAGLYRESNQSDLLAKDEERIKDLDKTFQKKRDEMNRKFLGSGVDPDEWFKKRQTKIEKKLAELDRKIAEAPDDPRRYLARAGFIRLHIIHGKWDVMANDCTKAIGLLKGKSDPESMADLGRACSMRAWFYKNRSKLDSAVTDYTTAINSFKEYKRSIRPILVKKYNNKAIIDIFISMYDTELKDCIGGRAESFEGLGLYRKALTDYRELCERWNDKEACKAVERIK